MDEYFIDTITVIRQTKDKYGSIIATDNYSVAGRIDYKLRQITNEKGEMIVSKARVTIPASIAIYPTDLINIDGVMCRIIDINLRRDFENMYWEIYVI